LPFGKAHVFYPEATNDRCTAALLLDIDPVGLVRTKRGPAGEGAILEQYVNDRPYVASSFMSVAISRVFGSALAGSSKGRAELVDVPLPLVARSSLMYRDKRLSGFDAAAVVEVIEHLDEPRLAAFERVAGELLFRP